nr:MAG TPA: hypothetical protein [Caudoviricetes sp.]
MQHLACQYENELARSTKRITKRALVRVSFLCIWLLSPFCSVFLCSLILGN